MGLEAVKSQIIELSFSSMIAKTPSFGSYLPTSMRRLSLHFALVLMLTAPALTEQTEAGIRDAIKRCGNFLVTTATAEKQRIKNSRWVAIGGSTVLALAIGSYVAYEVPLPGTRYGPFALNLTATE